jgi:protein tyrosine/serine phosphatase
MTLRFARVSVGCVFLAAAAWPVLAQSKPTTATHIKNFGRVNGIMYRGAQPDAQDYPALAAMGVKTVIDLQRDGEGAEQGLVEEAGMKFHRIEMSDSDHPRHEQIDEFLKLVTDPANQPVFVHCHGGRHRTGAVIAIYRMTYEGWDFGRAFNEMKQYQFDKGFGHGALKDCVYDHYEHLGHIAAEASQSATSNK